MTDWQAVSAHLERRIAELESENHILRDLASKDPLTGIANRRVLYERASRMSKPTIVMIDLDNFKPINDTYGHEAGNELLKAVAGRLCSAVRSSDIAARIGGDEFVCVFTASLAPEQATARVASCFTRTFKITAGNVKISASIGATKAEKSETFEEALTRADQDMYSRKRIAKESTRTG